MSIIETVTWLLVIITVIGSVILIFGEIANSLNVVTAGKTTACIGILGLIVVFVIYAKIKQYEMEMVELDRLGQLLQK